MANLETHSSLKKDSTVKIQCPDCKGLGYHQPPAEYSQEICDVCHGTKTVTPEQEQEYKRKYLLRYSRMGIVAGGFFGGLFGAFVGSSFLLGFIASPWPEIMGLLFGLVLGATPGWFIGRYWGKLDYPR